MSTQTLPRVTVTTRRRFSLLDKYFYFGMSLLTIVVIVYGFSFTVEKNLIHPTPARPLMLYLHAAVFTGWLGFFTLQSFLVRIRNVAMHRRIGWFGLALGIAVLLVGISTTLTMVRFNRDVMHSTFAESFMLIPLFDMLCFGVTFGLAIKWRRRPEYHRRLILVATCALTAAGFGRFPEAILPKEVFYLGVDFLIVLGVMRDLLVDRTVHRVYRYVLPLFMVGQTIVIIIVAKGMPFWRAIAHSLTT
ncbi:MAG TPA: hypothetical protein VN577_15085 [Terriglobales bacterium]|nr:hypothetical protein [Terriglobales bacterium]